jgi:hypothetical protein
MVMGGGLWITLKAPRIMEKQIKIKVRLVQVSILYTLQSTQLLLSTEY